MLQGGNWREFRDEIATLHSEATTEEDYVALLEAHSNLVAVARFAYNNETCQKLLPIVAAEYRTFLNQEAMQEGSINPVLRQTDLASPAANIERRDIIKNRLSIQSLNYRSCRRCFEQHLKLYQVRPPRTSAKSKPCHSLEWSRWRTKPALSPTARLAE